MHSFALRLVCLCGSHYINWRWHFFLRNVTIRKEGLVGCVASSWVDLVLRADNIETLVVVTVGGWELFFDSIELSLAILGAFNEGVSAVEVS